MFSNTIAVLTGFFSLKANAFVFVDIFMLYTDEFPDDWCRNLRGESSEAVRIDWSLENKPVVRNYHFNLPFFTDITNSQNKR
jgi:hypothetical protein